MGREEVCKKGCSLGEARERSFWRDLAAEFVATFLLVSVQCALPLTWGRNDIGSGIHTALGMTFIVTTTLWSLSEFGGIHMNPALSLSMMCVRRISIFRGLVYMVVQSAGGVAGAALIWGLTPEQFRETLASTELNPSMTVWQGLGVEIWLTFNLILTLHGCTYTGRKVNILMFSVPIGMAVGTGVLSGFASTGASMNPARSLGPAVMMGKWDHHWIYWVGPCLGSVLATFTYYVVFDKPDKNQKASHGTKPSKACPCMMLMTWLQYLF
ncbi:hypothetical protein CAPTEDRAFT_172599 [Capitella teleta]|uniref:Aquaporin n=1 Tax=Capitella teleta TaxID=283909 RepID=R7TZZ2_CAPTE|nr:hypothetical protein CAPTEDRAFT_172599 [Capitella teleta]|eukprot:ELT99187.1 hypothetical protein CAPTEDRAFT_172599 [Capitella teleta]